MIIMIIFVHSHATCFVALGSFFGFHCVKKIQSAFQHWHSLSFKVFTYSYQSDSFLIPSRSPREPDRSLLVKLREAMRCAEGTNLHLVGGRYVQMTNIFWVYPIYYYYLTLPTSHACIPSWYCNVLWIKGVHKITYIHFLYIYINYIYTYCTYFLITFP